MREEVVSSSDNRFFTLHDCPNFGDHLYFRLRESSCPSFAHEPGKASAKDAEYPFVFIGVVEDVMDEQQPAWDNRWGWFAK